MLKKVLKKGLKWILLKKVLKKVLNPKKITQNSSQKVLKKVIFFKKAQKRTQKSKFTQKTLLKEGHC